MRISKPSWFSARASVDILYGDSPSFDSVERNTVIVRDRWTRMWRERRASFV